MADTKWSPMAYSPGSTASSLPDDSPVPTQSTRRRPMTLSRRRLMQLVAGGAVASTVVAAWTDEASAQPSQTRTLTVANAGFEEPTSGNAILGWTQTH